MGGGLAAGGLAVGGGVWVGVGEGGGGLGGRGYVHPAAMYCTTTWCFALKGLRTMMCLFCGQ